MLVRGMKTPVDNWGEATGRKDASVVRRVIEFNPGTEREIMGRR